MIWNPFKAKPAPAPADLSALTPEQMTQQLGVKLHRLVQAYLHDRSRLTDLGGTWPEQLQGLIHMYDQAIAVDDQPQWRFERSKLLIQAGRNEDAWQDLLCIEPIIEPQHKRPILKALILLAQMREDTQSVADYQQRLQQLG